MRAALIALALGAAVPASAQSGVYEVVVRPEAGLPAHVVYRPADLGKVPARSLGVYVWGNGACSDDATSASKHLSEIASHGYLVIASGRIPPPGWKRSERPRGADGKLPADTTTAQLTQAIDWAVAEARRPGSPLRGKLKPGAIAVSGHSCGGLQALSAAADRRVATAVIMNSGFYNEPGGGITGTVSNKALLKKLHTPMLYVLGGPGDIAYPNGVDDFRRIGKLPTALVNIPVGHSGTFAEPRGGLAARIVIDWLDWQLKGERAAGRAFSGRACRLCRDPRLTYESKNLR